MGSQNIVSDVNITGSGDALQLNGSTYLNDCLLEGAGDSILGRGPEFFDHCELHSRGLHVDTQHGRPTTGMFFVNSRFLTPGNGMTEIARAPTNNGKNYPYAEAVLINCILQGISPVGWGAMGGDTTNMHYWEYNSTNAGRQARGRQPEEAGIEATDDAEGCGDHHQLQQSRLRSRMDSHDGTACPDTARQRVSRRRPNRNPECEGGRHSRANLPMVQEWRCNSWSDRRDSESEQRPYQRCG